MILIQMKLIVVGLLLIAPAANAQMYVHQGTYPSGIECTTISSSYGRTGSSHTSCTTREQRAILQQMREQQEKEQYAEYIDSAKRLGVAPACGTYGYRKAALERIPVIFQATERNFNTEEIQVDDTAIGTVEPGETMIQVAYRYGISLMDLIKLNPGIQESDIKPGTEILLKFTGQIRLKPFPSRVQYFDKQCRYSIGQENKLPQDYSKFMQVGK